MSNINLRTVNVGSSLQEGVYAIRQKDVAEQRGSFPHSEQRLLVSILSLGRADNVLQQLTSMPEWLSDCALDLGIACRIVVRNNDPNADFNTVSHRLHEISESFPALSCQLFSGSPNVGFGRGHNENITSAPSEYALILNDDIGFPHMQWLPRGIGALREDEKLALIGATENPQYINPSFGNGLFPTAAHLGSLQYAEASILLVKTPLFLRIGMFNEAYAWAMCEDADLSLRAQQLGYRINWMPMPHQHWRSTSFNALPGQVKSSILEANRATLFASWRQAFAAGRVGRHEVFDIWSDGIGDSFCALPHFFAAWNRMTPERQDAVVLNIRHPELIELFGSPRPRTTCFENLDDLKYAFGSQGISTIRSTRDINFSLPFNIHVLTCSALGTTQATASDHAAFAGRLRACRKPSTIDGGGPYCVLHVEFSRDHAGRAMPPSGIHELLRGCAELFDRVVLIGRERRLTESMTLGLSAKIIDLQGRLSLTELVAVVVGASYFAGIDSFPAHIAAAAHIPSAVFFGAVHPLSRIWNERLVWPLVADLSCIGCYHTHLEPSVPFCMRRDEACTVAVSSEQIRGVLVSMKEDQPYDWARAREGFQLLQAGMLHVIRHHPAPAERMFRPHGLGNEQVSNMIYRIAEQVSELCEGQYKSITIAKLNDRVQELETERFALNAQLEDAKRMVRASQIKRSLPTLPTRIMQIADLPLREMYCRVQRDEQWLDVEAFESDPQIFLPDLVGAGSRVHLRINYRAKPGTFMQVFWASPGKDFTEDHSELIASSGGECVADVHFDLAQGEVLIIRIDPIAVVGTCRFKAALAGSFEFAGVRDEGPPTVSLVTPAIPAKRGVRRAKSNGATH